MIKIADEWRRLLFVNWVQSLVTERLGLHGTQGTWELLIDQAGRRVILDIRPPKFNVVWHSAEQDRQIVQQVIDVAPNDGGRFRPRCLVPDSLYCEYVFA